MARDSFLRSGIYFRNQAKLCGRGTREFHARDSAANNSGEFLRFFENLCLSLSLSLSLPMIETAPLASRFSICTTKSKCRQRIVRVQFRGINPPPLNKSQRVKSRGARKKNDRGRERARCCVYRHVRGNIKPNNGRQFSLKHLFLCYCDTNDRSSTHASTHARTHAPYITKSPGRYHTANACQP